MRVARWLLSVATFVVVASFFQAPSTTPFCAAEPAQSSEFFLNSSGSIANATSSSAASPPSSLRIGVVLYNGTALLDYVGIGMYLEFLSMHGVSVQFDMIAETSGVIYSAPGRVPVYASTSFRDAATSSPVDILVVPGGPGRTSVIQNQAFMDYVSAAAKSAKYVLVVCTGAEIVARTGFLDGKNATTNKLAFDAIAATRPAVNWIRKARWVVDGKTWTSSGVSAGTDMGRAFVAAVYNESVANEITRTMEYMPDVDPSNDMYAT
uniref:DJ-1/PfpI domain-containing protein n=1 Tax=Globisporangium ultimum (strain ATCC 200006 / CBS 805.95 / DAOM BR144) TaxID=431595 RepID=K3WTX4_GLOUD